MYLRTEFQQNWLYNHIFFIAYEEYLSTITPAARKYITKILDWDNEDDKDLKEFAKNMEDWETTLPPVLGLTEIVLKDIREHHVREDLR